MFKNTNLSIICNIFLECINIDHFPEKYQPVDLCHGKIMFSARYEIHFYKAVLII